MTANRPTGRGRRAFTLIELLLATAIFAIILVAINTVFYSALRLRNRTSDAIEATLPVNQAFAIIRRDLLGAMPPGGTLVGDFKSGSGNANVGTRSNYGGSSATANANTGAAMAQGSGLSAAQLGSLDFFTTTGTLSDASPFADIQEVNYQLVPAADQAHALGKDLVRTVNRNLLAMTPPASQEQKLLCNVASLEFLFFDGMQWRNTWDTSMGDTNLPLAVEVRLLLAADTLQANNANRQPMEMMVPLEITTNSTAATNQTTGGQL
jgi:prepilin-type N-terminal cleavage/methylation domain-containing protein